MQPMQSNEMIVELTHLGLLRISGEDAKKLLQGQLTCHLDEISSVSTRLGAHCTPQGRMTSLFRLFYYQDAYFMQLPLEMVALEMAALQKYAVFFKVNISDASGQLKQIGYCGDNLSKLYPALPAHENEALYINELLIICIPGELKRYEIIGAESAIEELKKQLLAYSVNKSVDDWKHLNFIAGIPHIYPETSELFLPHEINLTHLKGVSFSKGCYTGQEIIARMEYKGKLKKHLYHVSITTDQPPRRGQDIYQTDKRCGSIVDYCQISYNYYELLVVAAELDIDNKITLQF